MMPLMFVTYMLQYLDKITLGYAAVMGIREDTVGSAHAIMWSARLTQCSISSANNIPGAAAPSTLAISLPVFQDPSGLSSFQLANTSQVLSCVGLSSSCATEQPQISHLLWFSEFSSAALRVSSVLASA